ncbi:uncharacterized protein J3R85_009845 [Psidium guajava]|nr:uncharacterized protein J3R85_009845 [Psidium guajava]
MVLLWNLSYLHFVQCTIFCNLKPILLKKINDVSIPETIRDVRIKLICFVNCGKRNKDCLKNLSMKRRWVLTKKASITRKTRTSRVKIAVCTWFFKDDRVRTAVALLTGSRLRASIVTEPTGFIIRLEDELLTINEGGGGDFSTEARSLSKHSKQRLSRTPLKSPGCELNSSPEMFLTRTEYDRGVNTFSPEGRLFQVEYAIEAIKLGSTAIGLKTKEGVVLAVEKRITSPLLEPSSVEKIMEIDDHIGCAMSGLIADARTLVEHARVETQNHRFSYGEPMTVESTTQAICDLALRFGEGDEESMSRPFGVSLLIAGHDENGPSLYYTDPSGTFWQCNAKAIGSGSEGADSSLQEQYNKDLTLQEAETIALSILKQVMEERVTPNNVDIAKVAPAYHLYTPAEVEAVISRL